MIDVDLNLFQRDEDCPVARFVYKTKSLVMCANIFYITGFNIWDMPGIYLLFYKNELVYIGKSDTRIGMRIKSHDNEDRFHFDGFMIIQKQDLVNENGGNDVNLYDIEQSLILDLQPKHNAIGKLKKYK